MSPSVVLHNYSRVEEALVVCSALQDAGFDATIDNLNHAILEWYLVPALGGIQVRLPATQLEPARAHLNEMVQTAEQRLTDVTGQATDPIHHRYWRAWTGLAIFVGVFNLFGIAVFWLIDKIIPPKWVTMPDSDVVPFFDFGLTIAEPPNLRGLLFLLALVLITWNEIFEIRRAEKRPANERNDPS
jgi:hypothetical protein